jgi:hypothetical protein
MTRASAGRGQHFGLAQKRRRDGHAKGNRLARAGLCGNEKIAACGIVFENGGLDRGKGLIALGLKGAGNRGGNIFRQGQCRTFGAGYTMGAVSLFMQGAPT